LGDSRDGFPRQPRVRIPECRMLLLCLRGEREIQIPFFFCGLRCDSEGPRVERSRVEESRVEGSRVEGLRVEG
jgi:hypothetical protein